MPMGDEAVFNNYGLLRSKEIPEGDWGFAGKTFKEPVEFPGTFAGKAIFKGCIFEKYMDFSNATFNGEVDFSGVVFKQGVSFREATFITRGADVSFENAVFLPFDRNEVVALKKDKNIAEVDFSGAKFGQEYERTHGDYEVWFGKGKSGPVLHYRKKGSSDLFAPVDFTAGFEDGLASSPLYQYRESIFRAFNSGKSNPGWVNFLNCRFGAFDLEKVTDEMAQKCIADETERLMKSGTNPENDPNLTAFKKFVTEKGNGIAEGEKSGIIQILSRHLSAKELEQLRVTAGMNVSFQSARFANAGWVSFWSARFANAGAVYFRSATFANAGAVYFRSATFANAGEVYFGSARFANAGWVYFGSATFANAGEVYFWSARFANAGAVYFGSATFANAGGVYFRGATFEKAEKVLFTFTIFLCQNAVDFSLAKFPNQSEQPFDGCYFGGLKTAEPKVMFNGVTLPKTTFAKGSSRDKSVALRDRLKESGVPLPSATEAWIQELEKAGKDRIPAETPIFDEDIVVSWRNIETPENITFENVNLHGALFDSKTLSRVNLSAPVWRTAKKGKPRRMLYEEELLAAKKGVTDSEYENLREQYVGLKNRYENLKDSQVAGDFHYGEMELRYRYDKLGWFNKAMTGAYRTFTGYGESMEAALVWLAVLVFYWPFATIIPNDLLRDGWIGKLPLPEFLAHYLKVLIHLITPFSWKEDLAGKVHPPLYFVPTILGQVLMYIQLPLFVLAVRRRFKR